MLKTIKDKVMEDIKKRKIHRDALLKEIYPANYLRLASCTETFQKGKKTYTYTRYDYFLIDRASDYYFTKAQRLTGDYAENYFTEKDIEKKKYTFTRKDGKEFTCLNYIRIHDTHDKEKPLTYQLKNITQDYEQEHIELTEQSTTKYSLNDLQIIVAEKNRESRKNAEIKPVTKNHQQDVDALFESFAGHK